MPIALRVVAAIESAAYETLAKISGWFPDDSGFGGRDPLADRAELRRDGVFQRNS